MSETSSDTPGPAGIGAADAPPSPRRPWSAAAVLGLAGACLLAALLVYGPMPVTIDGSLAVVPRSATLASLTGQGLLSAPRGDLVSLGGVLLRAGAGGTPTVLVDGAPRGPHIALASGARLTTVRGNDTVEPTVVRTVETTPTIRYVGRGPVESVEDSGTPGTARAIVGAISGEEESRTPVSAGSPMTVRREPAWKGPKEVALTFDDGPWRGSTDAIVRQLVAADATATFFVIGNRLHGGGAAIEKRVVAAGMEIGDHSQSHRLLGHARLATVKLQISRGARSIRRVLGVRTRWFRPPGGSTGPVVRSEAKKAGLRVIMWTVDPKDWKRPGARVIARRVLDRIRPGSVVLMHDGGGDRSQTVAALRLVIRGLKARGYSMVTLSRLYRLPYPVAP